MVVEELLFVMEYHITVQTTLTAVRFCAQILQLVIVVLYRIQRLGGTQTDLP